MIIISSVVRLVLIILSLLIYFFTALSCFGGLVPPAVTPIGSVLTIGMPVMLTISAVIIILWFCFGHWIIGSVGIMTLILCLSPIKMWFPMNSPDKPTPGETQFTVLTWNTLHGDDLEHPETKHARMLEEILRQDADIVCLQEVFGFSEKYLKHFDQNVMDSIYKKYPYHIGGGSYDAQVFSKYPLRSIYFGNINRYQLAEYFTVKFPEREIAMANIHLPSFALDETEKNIFSMSALRNDSVGRKKLGLRILHKLEYAIPTRAEGAKKVNNALSELAMPVVICGDFNDVPASWTYRMFLKNGFKDAYVATNFFPTYTFYPHLFYFHLDQVFYRGSIKPLSVKRLDIRTSDHLPLLATFEFLPDPY